MEADEVVAQITAMGPPRNKPLQGDVAKTCGGCLRYSPRWRGNSEGLDILVNNAGMFFRGKNLKS